MAELTPSDIVKFAQKALILTHQIEELLKMLSDFEFRGPRPSEDIIIIKCYNKILENSRKLFDLDKEFKDAISHLKDGTLTGEPRDFYNEVRKIIPQLRILKGTLDAFFEWLKHKEKKETT